MICHSSLFVGSVITLVANSEISLHSVVSRQSLTVFWPLQGVKGIQGKTGPKGVKGKRGPPVRHFASKQMKKCLT